PRHAWGARAGRLRPRGRGTAPRLRDPRDRARPTLGVLDPPGLDPRPADVTPSTVVELAGVQVTYGGATVLDVPALGLSRGEVLAVVGPNGSGKSTLLRVAGLLERPTRGAVRRPGTGPRARARGAAARRTVRRARHAVPDRAAAGRGGHPAPRSRHHDPGHPRSGRSAGAGRPGRGADGRTARPARRHGAR